MPSASFSRSLVRRFLTLCVSLAASTAALLAQTPSAADGFDPNVDGVVYVAVTQADGKVLIAGQFTAFRPNGDLFPTSRNNLARLNADGTLDTTFDPNVNGPVRALVVQPDGRILIAGDFTAVQPAGTTAPATRNRIARLNANGSLDATFAPGFLPGGILNLPPQVFALALQADGSVVAGGSFLSVTSTGSAVVTARRNLVRLSSAGVVDAAYNPNPNSIVLALALHAGGKVIVGGGFTTFEPNGATTAVTRNRIALLNINGTVDANFDPNANNGVTTLAVQRDGRILLGGYFTTLAPVGNGGATTRSHIARLYPDGTLDNDFQGNAAGNVTTIAVAPDGAVLIGGPFTSVWGRGGNTVARAFLVRFTADGTVDTAFAPGINSEVSAIAFQADGKIVTGGYFTRVAPVGATTAVTRNRLARFNANGSLDANFEIEAGGRPLVSVVQADGKVIIGGSFTSVGGATHNFLARLNTDGSVDPTYTPTMNSRVLAAAIQADGKVIIGGPFTTVNDQTRNHIARLNPDGTLDTEFNPNVDGLVGVITLQSDGKVIIGGAFTSVQPTGATTSTFRNNIARLTAAGQLDTPFDPSPSNTVSAIVVQADGKVIFGGAFTSLVPNGAQFGTTQASLARVNTDGTLDTTFSPNFGAQVTSLALQTDGKLVVGGLFNLVAGTGASEPTVRNRLVRLNADGTIDTAWDPNANGNVLTVALQPDGKLLVGGTFVYFVPNGATNWTGRRYIARINTDGTLDATWNLDIDELSGNRVDSIRVLSDGRALIGGSFTSVQPGGVPPRVVRKNYLRLTATGAVDTTFTFGGGGSTAGLINALAVQADGKVVAAGMFSDVGGARTTNIARFNPEGTADTSFGATLSADGPINAVAVRPTATATASQLAGLAWLNANGSLRSGFTPGSDVRLSGLIDTVAFQADGKVLVGGSFANLTGASSGNLLRFNANGSLDTTFAPVVNGQVTGIVVQSDGKIIIVGAFTLVNNGVRNRIARLEADGLLDATYDPNASAPINAIVLQSDGKVVVGGSFTGFTPNAAATATVRNFLARLETSGAVDTVYNPNLNANVNGLALQADGKVIAGGAFSSATPNGATTAVTRNFVARFNLDGTLDTAFDPNTNNVVNAIALQANGDVVLGGAFTSLQPTGETTGAAFNYLARVKANNTIDRSFNPNPNGFINTLAVQADGGILAGGTFTTLQPGGLGTPVTRNHLARIAADGSLDIAFNPDVTGDVFSLMVRSDGSVIVAGTFTGVQGNGLLLVGGAFANIGGLAAKNLALLNDDGSINSGFLPAPNGAVNAILALSDGRFVVGGAFTTIAGATRNRLARFNADGTLDAAFNPNVSATVTALALQPDGKIVIGGAFSTVGEVSRPVVARLDASGALDATFTAGFSAPSINIQTTIAGIEVQADGKILVGGTSTSSGITFTSQAILVRLNADGTPDNTFTTPSFGSGLTRLVAFSLQADGKIVAAGSFNVGGRANLARFNADGAIDTTFNPAPNGAVNALALQSDGRLMIGGSFTTVGGLSRVGLARLAATGPATNTLAVTADRASVLWLRSGTAGEVAGARFELSLDGRTWTILGEGVRTANGWQRSGLQLPASISFFLRVRGVAPSSAGTSSGVYESVREFNYASASFSAPAAGAFPGDAGVAQFFSVDPFTGQATGVFPNAAGGSVVVAGVPSTAKITGAATEVGTNIVHANGNVYDQVLLQGAVTTVTADAGQVVRLSYVGLNNDIVQVEFSGAGSLSLLLDNASGPAVAQNYNQPSVSYVRGHAGIIINGANQTTNVSVFSVGRLTAVDQGLFRSDVTYAGVADLSYLAITSTDGKFGSIRTGNASYYATSGLTGIYAPGVTVTGPVYVGDISGFDRAVATLVLGFANDVNVTGGDLLQGNGQPVAVSGFTELKLVSGTTSNGALLPAQANRAVLEENDADVTSRVIVNPPTP